MKRSKFSLSHYRLSSVNMGWLNPISCYEVLPGDTIQQATSCLIRLSPQVAPTMHPVHARIHHWYVPYRLLWSDWEDFITGGPDGMDVSEFPVISSGSTGFKYKGLADHLGIPSRIPDMSVSALPFRAYNLIWNEFYRDQDLEDELDISDESGLDATTSTELQRCSWEKDYFTSSRPWTQKGPDVSIPLGGTAPVNMTGSFQPLWKVDVPGGTPSTAQTFMRRDPFSGALHVSDTSNNTGLAAEMNLQQGTAAWTADLSSASAVNVNQLREMFAIQRYQEARARYGSRYTEYLRYLGVRSSDARLQRPEYLGGGKQTIQFSEVLQTAEGANPVGTMAGHGIAAMRSNRYRRFFEEHGVVISLLSIRPKTIYSQGCHRMWYRRVKEDFFQKELQHIGQQEVFNKELYVEHSDPDGVFGYQDRYDEYRRMESNVSGEYRDLLDYWHMARKFSNDPALNSTFVSCVPTLRTFADTNPDYDHFYLMSNHSIQARRLVAKLGKSFIF